MRYMSKKGISEIISYVMLLSLALTMAGGVFAYLKFYAQNPFPEEKCPDVSAIIREYNCSNGILNLTVQNKGRFDLDGYTIKINNGTNATYVLRPVDSNFNYVILDLVPDEYKSELFNFSKYSRINSIEIEAVRGTDSSGRPILCEDSIITQNIVGC